MRRRFCFENRSYLLFELVNLDRTFHHVHVRKRRDEKYRKIRILALSVLQGLPSLRLERIEIQHHHIWFCIVKVSLKIVCIINTDDIVTFPLKFLGQDLSGESQVLHDHNCLHWVFLVNCSCTSLGWAFSYFRQLAEISCIRIANAMKKRHLNRT